MIGNVTTNAITPILYKKKFKINYDKDVVPVTRAGRHAGIIPARHHEEFRVENVPEFVAYAKKNPGKVRYGSVGVGSYPALRQASFAKRAGVDMVHIPNKAGASGVINDMVTGDTQVAFLNVASRPLVKAGKLKADRARQPTAAAGLPRRADHGGGRLPGVGTLAWQGLFAPAATPKAVLETLFKAIAEALKNPERADKFHKRHFTWCRTSRQRMRGRRNWHGRRPPRLKSLLANIGAKGRHPSHRGTACRLALPRSRRSRPSRLQGTRRIAILVRTEEPS